MIIKTDSNYIRGRLRGGGTYKKYLNSFWLIPSALGEITVYEKFWMKPEKGIHPLVIYADLMGTTDGRCREQAQRILNNELSYIK